MSAAPSPGRATSAEWTRRPERGSPFLIRFIVWFSRRAGRAPARVLLRVTAAYFFLTAGAARRASREFLRRCLGREPTLAERFGLLFAFASTVHDRVFFLEGRFDLFEVDVRGAELFDERGAIVMGAHLGSFEAARACGRGRRAIAMAMYEDNARKVQSALAAIAPEAEKDIVPLGRIDSMLRLEERLESGALVGVLADRTLADEPVLEIPFLGAPAPFPTGPMRMAAALRARVAFMAGLYRGGNRYEIRFEPIADFTDLEGVARVEREARVNEAVRRYAECLERHCRLAPDNFFNFHRFWR
ncbi:MAG TPA: acyl-CoA synthetase [Usitatibacter sp.]|nr:acyl-CoA synthetase [Usitatibacter sp.]